MLLLSRNERVAASSVFSCTRCFCSCLRQGLTEDTRLPARSLCMSPCCSFLWRSRPDNSTFVDASWCEVFFLSRATCASLVYGMNCVSTQAGCTRSLWCDVVEKSSYTMSPQVYNCISLLLDCMTTLWGLKHLAHSAQCTKCIQWISVISKSDKTKLCRNTSLLMPFSHAADTLIQTEL